MFLPVLAGLCWYNLSITFSQAKLLLFHPVSCTSTLGAPTGHTEVRSKSGEMRKSSWSRQLRYDIWKVRHLPRVDHLLPQQWPLMALDGPCVVSFVANWAAWTECKLEEAWSVWFFDAFLILQFVFFVFWFSGLIFLIFIFSSNIRRYGIVTVHKDMVTLIAIWMSEAKYGQQLRAKVLQMMVSWPYQTSK